MREGSPSRFFEDRGEKEEEKRFKALALELSEGLEIFSFPGIDPKGYEELKAIDEKYPGYATPIDELIERFKNEGMRVMLGSDPGNVFILPAQSTNIENDSIFPRYLRLTDGMDQRMRSLILMGRG